MDNKANDFFNWLVINILLPLLPVITKLMITIFANKEKISLRLLNIAIFNSHIFQYISACYA